MMRTALATLALLLILAAGCGQKGPLQRPAEEPPDADETG